MDLGRLLDMAVGLPYCFAFSLTQNSLVPPFRNVLAVMIWQLWLGLLRLVSLVKRSMP
nr:hypothetical protein Q903MT_gene2250 [Picea sitchensis]